MRVNFGKSSPELVARFTELTPPDEHVVRKPMFGWPCLFVNGNLFMGLHREGLIVRLPAEELGSILALSDATAFEPMPGRIMAGYAMITNPLAWNEKDLKEWIAKSLAFARQLPTKEKKPAKKERKW